MEVQPQPSLLNCTIGEKIYEYINVHPTNGPYTNEIFCAGENKIVIDNGTFQSSSEVELDPATGYYTTDLDAQFICFDWSFAGGGIVCSGTFCKDGLCGIGQFEKGKDANDATIFTYDGGQTICDITNNNSCYLTGTDFAVPHPQSVYIPPLVEEHWYDQCEPLETNVDCSLISATCIDGPSTKTIDGEQITKDCWEYETNYQCEIANTVSECDVFTQQGCTQSYSECDSTTSAGTCLRNTNEYLCDKEYLVSAETEHLDTTSSITSEEWNVQECAQLDVDSSCTLQQEVCIEGPETRNINGLDVTRDCWKMNREYQCDGQKYCNKTLDLEVDSAFKYECLEAQKNLTSETCQEELNLEVIPVDPILTCNPGDLLLATKEYKQCLTPEGGYIGWTKSSLYCYGEDEILDISQTNCSAIFTYSNIEELYTYTSVDLTDTPIDGLEVDYNDCSSSLKVNLIDGMDFVDGQDDCATYYTPKGATPEYFTLVVECNSTDCAFIGYDIDIETVPVSEEYPFGLKTTFSGVDLQKPVFVRPQYIPQPPIVNDQWVDRCGDLKARVP